MTEIRIDIDFGHAPDLVWRALTDRRLLSRWFMLTDLEPVQGSRFQLIPEALPGFDGPIDGELTDLVPTSRMGMRWRGDQLHARVIWDLTPTPDGCRLTVSQSGFLGVRGSVRRRALLFTYRQLFGVRLLAVLDALARGDEPVAPPPPRLPTEAVPRRDRRRQILAVMAAALLVALVGVLVSNLPAETSDPAAAETTRAGSPVASYGATSAPPPAATATRRPPDRSPSAPAATPTPGRTGGLSAPVATGATLAAPAELSARYATLSTALLGYRGEIAVENRGGTAAPGWTVTITVPPLAVVTGVEGPRPSQQGATVTFSGGSVAVGASTVIVFDVALNTQLVSAQPLSCEVDGTPCAGL